MNRNIIIGISILILVIIIGALFFMFYSSKSPDSSSPSSALSVSSTVVHAPAPRYPVKGNTNVQKLYKSFIDQGYVNNPKFNKCKPIANKLAQLMNDQGYLVLETGYTCPPNLQEGTFFGSTKVCGPPGDTTSLQLAQDKFTLDFSNCLD